MEILENKDISAFDDLYLKNFSDQFPLPSMNNTSTVRTIKHNEKVVASGLVKALVEAIIVTDQSASPHVRMKAVDMMLGSMLVWCHQYHIEQVHAFVKEDFAKYLIRHCGFEHTKDISLVLNIGGRALG